MKISTVKISTNKNSNVKNASKNKILNIYLNLIIVINTKIKMIITKNQVTVNFCDVTKCKNGISLQSM